MFSPLRCQTRESREARSTKAITLACVAGGIVWFLSAHYQAAKPRQRAAQPRVAWGGGVEMYFSFSSPSHSRLRRLLVGALKIQQYRQLRRLQLPIK